MFKNDESKMLPTIIYHTFCAVSSKKLHRIRIKEQIRYQALLGLGEVHLPCLLALEA